MCTAIIRHRPHSYLGKEPKRYTRAICSEAFSNTINAGFTFVEGMKWIAGRVVGDLWFCRCRTNDNMLNRTLVYRLSARSSNFRRSLVELSSRLSSTRSSTSTDSHKLGYTSFYQSPTNRRTFVYKTGALVSNVRHLSFIPTACLTTSICARALAHCLASCTIKVADSQ
jgi:hypothetical protein